MSNVIDDRELRKAQLPDIFVKKATARHIEQMQEVFAFVSASKHLRLGSPIEALFLCGLFEMSTDYGDIFTATGSNGAARNGGVVKEPPIGNHLFFVEPQRKIGNYRVDFVIGMLPEVPEVRVIVECDGHDFHQKTKEQVARDKKRDRDLLMMGYKVMRFTGSEIHNDALACGGDVLDFLVRQDFALNNEAEQ